MTSQELNQLLVLRLDVLGAYVQLDRHLILGVSLDIQADVKVEQIQRSVQNDLIVPITMRLTLLMPTSPFTESKIALRA